VTATRVLDLLLLERSSWDSSVCTIRWMCLDFLFVLSVRGSVNIVWAVSQPVTSRTQLTVDSWYIWYWKVPGL
jgi:hypothetical protein